MGDWVLVIGYANIWTRTAFHVDTIHYYPVPPAIPLRSTSAARDVDLIILVELQLIRLDEQIKIKVRWSLSPWDSSVARRSVEPWEQNVPVHLVADEGRHGMIPKSSTARLTPGGRDVTEWSPPIMPVKNRLTARSRASSPFWRTSRPGPSPGCSHLDPILTQRRRYPEILGPWARWCILVGFFRSPGAPHVE